MCETEAYVRRSEPKVVQPAPHTIFHPVIHMSMTGFLLIPRYLGRGKELCQTRVPHLLEIGRS